MTVREYVGHARAVHSAVMLVIALRAACTTSVERRALTHLIGLGQRECREFMAEARVEKKRQQLGLRGGIQPRIRFPMHHPRYWS